MAQSRCTGISEESRKTIDAEAKLREKIGRLGFLQKYDLIEPFFALHFPEQAGCIKKINELRNGIFHGRRSIHEAKFDNQPLSKEKTVGNLFLAAQEISMVLDKFGEMIDAPHATAERKTRRETAPKS